MYLYFPNVPRSKSEFPKTLNYKYFKGTSFYLSFLIAPRSKSPQNTKLQILLSFKGILNIIAVFLIMRKEHYEFLNKNLRVLTMRISTTEPRGILMRCVHSQNCWSHELHSLDRGISLNWVSSGEAGNEKDMLLINEINPFCGEISGIVVHWYIYGITIFLSCKSHYSSTFIVYIFSSNVNKQKASNYSLQ